jgi:hypothetical protein
MAREIIEEWGDVEVEAGDVGRGQPGEDGLTIAVRACVERTMKQLVNDQPAKMLIEAYNVVPFSLYVGGVLVMLAPMAFA